MFGYKKGSFTGAVSDKKGLFEEAHEGTLFLDEVGEMDLDLQSKLLRVLEEQTFTKIGETKETKVNVRIIAATNRDLHDESRHNRFREDLYYRLAGFKIVIPPLRQRKEDIEELANYFLNIYSTKINKKIEGFNKDFIENLKHHDWKGNIRELKNIIERAVILAESNSVITSALLPYELSNINYELPITNYESGSVNNESLIEVEKLQILKVLKQTKGNKTKAAEVLGIGITTLYRKLQEYKI